MTKDAENDTGNTANTFPTTANMANCGYKHAQSRLVKSEDKVEENSQAIKAINEALERIKADLRQMAYSSSVSPFTAEGGGEGKKEGSTAPQGKTPHQDSTRHHTRQPGHTRLADYLDCTGQLRMASHSSSFLASTTEGGREGKKEGSTAPQGKAPNQDSARHYTGQPGHTRHHTRQPDYHLTTSGTSSDFISS